MGRTFEKLCILLASGCSAATPAGHARPKAAPVVEAKAQGEGAPIIDGMCMRGASDFEAAEAWANSFRLPGIETSQTPSSRIIAPEKEAGESVRSVLQVEIYRDAEIAVLRQFVFVKREDGISGCAVFEEREKRWSEGKENYLHPEVDGAAVDGQLATVSAKLGFLRKVDVICLLGTGGMGCVTVRRHNRVAHGADALGVRVKSDDGRVERGIVPFEIGVTRVVSYDWLDGGEKLITVVVKGRPGGGQPGTSEAPAAVAPLTEAQQRTWLGTFASRGPCVAKAPTWDAAEIWAESFRADGKQDPERAVSLRRSDVSGTAGDHTVRTYMQDERLAGFARWVRGFVMVKTSSGVSACMVSEDELMYGYIQAPTPKKGTLREAGVDRFEYDAAHTYYGATNIEKEADWTVGCAVEGPWLGCASLRRRWTDAELEDGKDVVKEYRAGVERTKSGYRYTLEGKPLDVTLRGGQALGVWRNPPEVLVTRAKLAP